MNQLKKLFLGLLLAACLAAVPLLPACTSLGSSGKVSAPQQAYAAMPAYSGASYTVVNGDVPYFTDKEMTLSNGTEEYGALDKKGRCTYAFAIVGKDTMPDDDRGEIYSIKPTGWQHVEYSFVDGLSLYNRCHLIAWSLTDEDANECNLVTGTRSMNLAMVDFEQEVCNYVRQTGKHVAYRSTPVFEGNNLVCSGILLEAKSVEDGGKSVQFCVYLYNVEPGVEINYATGDSKLAEEGSVMYNARLQKGATVSKGSSGSSAGSGQGASEKASIDETVVLENDPSKEPTFALNTKSGKYHEADCENVSSISEKNLKMTTASRQEVERAGYVASGCCG